MTAGHFTGYSIPRTGFSEVIDTSISEITDAHTYVIEGVDALRIVFEHVRAQAADHHNTPTSDEVAELAASHFLQAMNGQPVEFDSQTILTGMHGPTNVPSAKLKKVNRKNALALYIVGLNETQRGSWDDRSNTWAQTEDRLGLQRLVIGQCFETTVSTLTLDHKPGFRFFRLASPAYPGLLCDNSGLACYGKDIGDKNSPLLISQPYHQDDSFVGWSLFQTHALPCEASLDKRAVERQIDTRIQGIMNRRQQVARSSGDKEEQAALSRQLALLEAEEEQILNDWSTFKAARSIRPAVIEERQKSRTQLQEWRRNPNVSVGVTHAPDRIYRQTT